MILSYLISSSLGQKTEIKCSDWNECQYHEIDGNEIECSSYIGCQMSTIYQKGVGGQLTCSGRESCQSANSLIAEGTIHCSGHRSCYTVKPMVADAIQCSGSYSCFCDGSEAKGNAITAFTHISCGGFKACAYCKMNSAKNVNCDGSHSCTETIIDAEGDITCSGNSACSDCSINAKTKAGCLGAMSCKNSEIEAEDVELNGHRSGYRARVHAKTVVAIGFGSLEGAEVDSTDKPEMNVTLAGEATTIDTSIICRNDSSCAVECIDECPELEVISMSAARTRVTITTSIEIEEKPIPIMKTTMIECNSTHTNPGCPVIMESDSACIDDYFESYLAQKRLRIKRYDDTQTVDDNEDFDEFAMNFVQYQIPKQEQEMAQKQLLTSHVEVCVNEGDCRGRQLTDAHQECYGKESCENADIDQSHIDCLNDCHGYTECFGQSSCENADIYTPKGTIYCDGKLSCSGDSMLEGDIIQCAGAHSCGFIEHNITAKTLSCEGRSGCEQSNLFADSSVKCLAKDACFASDIRSKVIECSGYNACAESVLTAENTLECNSLLACAKSEIKSKKKVIIDGDRGAAEAHVMAPFIQANGFYGLTRATIDSGKDKLVIKMYGDLAGLGATVICRPGSICKLDCKSNGCKNLNFVCLPGSSCFGSPRGCFVERRTPKTINGIVCPERSDTISDLTLLQTEYARNANVKVKANKVINVGKTMKRWTDANDEQIGAFYILFAAFGIFLISAACCGIFSYLIKSRNEKSDLEEYEELN